MVEDQIKRDIGHRKDEVINMLSKLLNKRFHSISRAVDMLCLCLGEDFSFITEKGKRIDVAEYSLHVQSQWRFRDGGEILLASRDIYEPYSDAVSDDWEYDRFGRPDELSSVFNVNVKKLIHKMQGAEVTECFLSEVNDITIIFSNGIIFEQFMSAARKSEEWRLIDYPGDLHTICYDENGKISVE